MCAWREARRPARRPRQSGTELSEMKTGETKSLWKRKKYGAGYFNNAQSVDLEAIFRVPLCLCVFVQNLSYENEFDLHDYECVGR